MNEDNDFCEHIGHCEHCLGDCCCCTYACQEAAREWGDES